MSSSKSTNFKVISPNVKYTDKYIEANIIYNNTIINENENGFLEVNPTETEYKFKTELFIPKLG